MDVGISKLNLPYVSIIIPVLNGEQHLGRCLDSVFYINYPKELFEVIVVDNGSTDSTVEIAKRYDTKVLVKPGVNVSSIRNYGAKHSRGKILAFLDSDCIVSREWLNKAIPYFNNDKIAMVGSLVRAPVNCNWVGQAWDICYKKRLLKGEINRLGAANMFVRRIYFEEIKGFDDSLVTCEDDDICFRIRQNGYKIYSAPEITVYHLGEPKSLSEFFKVATWRGYETFKLFLKNKGGMSFKITLYSLFYLVTMFSIFLSIIYVLIFQKGYLILGLCAVLMLIFPFYFATTAAIRSSSWKYFFHFAILYLILGIANATSIFRIVKEK